MDVVGFDLRPWEVGLHAVTPSVNGVSLVEMVRAYEGERDFDIVGGYDGLVWSLIKLDDPYAYLMGQEGYPVPGMIQLLGCECGEWGCWPLEAGLATADGGVTWGSFQQPHRRDRDYSGFGPFVFEPDQYETAVATVVAAIAVNPK